MSNNSRRNNPNNQYNYLINKIWQLNRNNIEITRINTFEEEVLSQEKIDHQELVKEISKLDQLIRTREQLIKYREQKIIDNTTRIRDLREKLKEPNPTE